MIFMAVMALAAASIIFKPAIIEILGWFFDSNFTTVLVLVDFPHLTPHKSTSKITYRDISI